MQCQMQKVQGRTENLHVQPAPRCCACCCPFPRGILGGMRGCRVHISLQPSRAWGSLCLWTGSLQPRMASNFYSMSFVFQLALKWGKNQLWLFRPQTNCFCSYLLDFKEQKTAIQNDFQKKKTYGLRYSESLGTGLALGVQTMPPGFSGPHFLLVPLTTQMKLGP